MKADRKTVVDLPLSDHITYIKNEEAHDRTHAVDAPRIRPHVEHTGSAIYKSEVSELIGYDLTPSTWMHIEPPPGVPGRINRYFGTSICPLNHSPEQIEELIETHSSEQEEAMRRFGKKLGQLSRDLLEARARLLAITPG